MRTATSTTGSASCAEGRGEAGTGIVGTFVGGLVLLVLLLFAVQVAIGLYTDSVLSAVAYDAAKSVAGADAAARPDAAEAATRDARRSLGRIGARARFEWAVEGDDVVLRVAAPRPRLVLAGLPDVQRTVRVRIEAVR